ncbi:MAG: serine hydrolase domain-containing protein, partial [Hyphomicrobiales bacterium]
MLKRHWKALIPGLVLAGIAAVMLWAPYLPRLAHEGFPAPVWPAPGSFAEVAGKTGSAPPAGTETAALDPQLRELLAGSGAKALLAFSDGALAMEHYAEGFTAKTRFNSYSLVKSLIGALVLKAVADGRLSGLDQPLGAALPDAGDETFRAVTLHALLEMRSGVLFETGGAKSLSGVATKDLEAAFANPFGPLARLHVQGLDAVKHRLSRTPEPVPKFNYQNINTALLGAVLERAYGRPLEAILSEKIWAPAGAAPARWRRYNDSAGVSAYCCLYARARDWVKVARFITANGSTAAPFLPDLQWRALLGLDLEPARLRKGVYGHHMRHDILDRPG